MDEKQRVQKGVLEVYQKVNPSTFNIEDPEYFARHRQIFEEYFIDHLKLPLAIFKGARVLDLGAGSGDNSLFYALWGGGITCVEMNEYSITRFKKLFQKFGLAKQIETIYHGSLFDWDYAGNEPFDITLSDGVLHHTYDARLGFAKQVKYLKKGGFTILGICTEAAQFQRNLQRYVLYTLSDNEELKIVELARRLFKEHLERAVRVGGRSEEAVIYDTFVNPKVKSFSASTVLGWFKDEGLRLYSSWPPIVAVPLGDSQWRPTIRFEEKQFRHIGVLSELYWMLHREDDAEWLAPLFITAAHLDQTLACLTAPINDVTPQAAARLQVDSIVENLDRLSVEYEKLAPVLPYVALSCRLQCFAREVADVLKLVRERDVARLERAIPKYEILFRGTCGLGMTYFVGYKL
jgi:SAM-dependent methyltransferase